MNTSDCIFCRILAGEVEDRIRLALVVEYDGTAYKGFQLQRDTPTVQYELERALEALTGVDIVIDDTPEIVTVSCFDPVRREIAKLALSKLVTDGRIQPARIEDMVNRAHTDIEQTIWKAGEQATFDMAVTGWIPN